MAHMVETMAYAGELPWHGLGTKVDENIGVDGMLKEAGLDWRVAKIPSFANFNGKEIYSGHDMLVRESDGQPLDMVKQNWVPVQNADAFEFFREFVEADEIGRAPSELQSHHDLVCRLLLEKKKKIKIIKK